MNQKFGRLQASRTFLGKFLLPWYLYLMYVMLLLTSVCKNGLKFTKFHSKTTFRRAVLKLKYDKLREYVSIFLESVISVVLQFYPWFSFYFPLFLCMVMYGNECKTKIKIEPGIKLNHNRYNRDAVFCHSKICSNSAYRSLFLPQTSLQPLLCYVL